ncbi:MAG: FecR domain-containing protein [Bacteroidales bacterium]|nr:FecR domain-containing protein [Bacteroidales bacterium]
MDKNQKKQADEFIARCLTGNPSEEELRDLETWIGESVENLKYYRNFRNIWEGSAELKLSTENALGKVMKQIDKQQSRQPLGFYLQKIAAVLFIPLLISMLWMSYARYLKKDQGNMVYHEVTAAFGTFSLLNLPDGSKVWLNAGSKLRYPEQFTGDMRLVDLTGEAYFEIISDESSPFLVNTKDFTVRATGTRFNVMAYQNCNFPSVALAEGKVTVRGKRHASKSENEIRLKPDQLLKYSSLTGKMEIVNEDVYKYYAWKDGKLVFRNDLFTEVTKRISIQYNVDIEIIGDQVKQYRYRATLKMSHWISF